MNYMKMETISSTSRGVGLDFKRLRTRRNVDERKKKRRQKLWKMDENKTKKSEKHTS